MTRFAKVFDVADTQVLFFLTTADDGAPCVRMITEVNGHGTEVVSSFNDKAQANAWEQAEALFKALGHSSAITFHRELCARLEAICPA